MPTIADLSFPLDDGSECGIAYLLHERPETAVSERYASGHLLASPTSPYAVLRFTGSSTRQEVTAQGTELLHQALDLHSMLGRADLQLRDIRNEFMVWWADGAGHHFLLSSTVTLTMKVGHVQLVAHDAAGNVIPPVPQTPLHHPGFRFFRLSQVTDDLYDAFRNMYLAFECLLSTRHPKTQRQEIQWLTDALTASAQDLQISALCPAGTTDPVAHIIARVYNGARLPLFHAKDGKTYFAPGANHADLGNGDQRRVGGQVVDYRALLQGGVDVLLGTGQGFGHGRLLKTLRGSITPGSSVSSGEGDALYCQLTWRSRPAQ